MKINGRKLKKGTPLLVIGHNFKPQKWWEQLFRMKHKKNPNGIHVVNSLSKK